MDATIKPARARLGEVLRDSFVLLLKLATLVGFFAAISLLLSIQMNLQAAFVDYLMVMLLGAMVGFVEIISRYADAPFPTSVTWPGIFYMLVNALVAASALWAIRLFNWNVVPGANGSTEITRWAQVIVSGLGAMAIFRSSLFVLGKEENTVSVGPNAVLQILLQAIDKEVDRQRGQERARTVRRLMSKVEFDSAGVMTGNLIDIVRNLMQNLGDEDRKKIDDLRAVEGKVLLAGIDPELKKYVLGLQLMDLVGENVLRDAITIITEIASMENQNRPAPTPSAGKAVEDSVQLESYTYTTPTSWSDVLKNMPPENMQPPQPEANAPEGNPPVSAPAVVNPPPASGPAPSAPNIDAAG